MTKQKMAEQMKKAANETANAMIECPKCEGRGWLRDPVAVGAEMRKLRIAAGITLTKMAKSLSMTISHLCKLERAYQREHESRPTLWAPYLIEKYKAVIEREGKR